MSLLTVVPWALAGLVVSAADKAPEAEDGRASPNFTAGAGFNGIAVALLGRSHPVGVLIAGILFGALDAGGRQMQVAAGVRIDLIAIIQSLIIVFVAAPLLMRAAFPWAFRNRSKARS